MDINFIFQSVQWRWVDSVAISAAYKIMINTQTLLLINMHVPGDWNSSLNIQSIIEYRVQSMDQSRVQILYCLTLQGAET